MSSDLKGMVGIVLTVLFLSVKVANIQKVTVRAIKMSFDVKIE